MTISDVSPTYTQPVFDMAVAAIVDASRGWPLLPLRRPGAHHRDRQADDDRSVALHQVLETLCADLGFCLPAAETARLVRSQAFDIGEFVDAVFVAVGLRSDHFFHLRQQVWDRVEHGFPPDQVTVGSRHTSAAIERG